MPARRLFILGVLLVILSLIQWLLFLEWLPLSSFIPSPWDASAVSILFLLGVIALVLSATYSIGDTHKEV